MATSFLHFSPTPTFSSIPKTKIHNSTASYCKPVKVSMSQNQTFGANINSEVDANIHKALPPSAVEPMNNLIFEVPRSMAPALCIAACEAVGGQKEDAIPAASALHLMHVATEYPLLSAQSKSKPIVPLAYELLAGMENPASNNSETVLQVMIEIGRAMGSQGIIDSQYLKGLCKGYDEGVIDQLVLENKGGRLFSCGAACGAILGGGSEEEIEKLRRYGIFVGMIHGIRAHNRFGREKSVLKLADSFRVLALKEIKDMGVENIEHIYSIMDGVSAYLSGQKFQFH